MSEFKSEGWIERVNHHFITLWFQDETEGDDAKLSYPSSFIEWCLFLGIAVVAGHIIVISSVWMRDLFPPHLQRIAPITASIIGGIALPFLNRYLSKRKR